MEMKNKTTKYIEIPLEQWYLTFYDWRTPKIIYDLQRTPKPSNWPWKDDIYGT